MTENPVPAHTSDSTTIFLNPQENANHPLLKEIIEKTLVEFKVTGWQVGVKPLPTGDLIVGDQAIVEIKWSFSDLCDIPRLFDEGIRMRDSTFPIKLLLYTSDGLGLEQETPNGNIKDLRGVLLSEKLAGIEKHDITPHGKIRPTLDQEIAAWIARIAKRRGHEPSKLPAPKIPKKKEMEVPEAARAIIKFLSTDTIAADWLEAGKNPLQFFVEMMNNSQMIPGMGDKRRTWAQGVLSFSIPPEAKPNGT